MNSQQQIILNILDDKNWHCSSEFYAKYMADPRKRLHEIRQKGYLLEAKRCKLHNYHRGGSKMWRLVSGVVSTPKHLTTGQIERKTDIFPRNQSPLFAFNSSLSDI